MKKNTRAVDFCVDRIDFTTNFAVITNVVIKRVHSIFLLPLHSVKMYVYTAILRHPIFTRRKQKNCDSLLSFLGIRFKVVYTVLILKKSLH